jgi:hypothetical protein
MRFEFFVASRYLRAKRRQVEAFCGRERGQRMRGRAGARSRNPERSEGPLIV